jgi:hypothetical protein
MTARHKYRNDDGDMEFVPNVLRWGYAAAAMAEEGQSGRYEIVIDDPDMTLNFVGHRRYTIYEEESDDSNEILVDGITQAARIAHTGGDITNPDGRVWVLEVNDLNALWTYRVMTSDGHERPAETDVERMEWLAGTEELSYVEDVTLLSTDDPVSMDADDVRGRTTGQVADSCAQESGKNYWMTSEGTAGEIGAEIMLWYGADGLPVYDSPLALSNDPADLDMPDVNDGTATTYPIGSDTELRRDYARQYDQAYGEYQAGAKFIKAAENPYAPEITASHRDISYPAPEIKTAAKMKARLLRVLRDHATPDEVITTTIDLPDNKATSIRAGMRVPFKATHEPGYEEFRYLRVMSANPTPYGNRYKIKLELQGPGEAAPPPPWTCPLDSGIVATESKVYENLGSATTDDDGVIWYTNSNQTYFGVSSLPGWSYIDGPLPNTLSNGLGFPDYSPSGDAGGSSVVSTVAFILAGGAGTVTSHWGLYVGAGSNVVWEIVYRDASTPDASQDSGTFAVTGETTHVIDVPDLPGDAVSCYRMVRYVIGTPGGSGARFRDLEWAAA